MTRSTRNTPPKQTPPVGVAPPAPTSGSVLHGDESYGNAWGTIAAFLAFKAELATYVASLVGKSSAELLALYNALVQKAGEIPGLGDANTQAGAEHRMYVAETRLAYDAALKAGK